MDLNSCARQPFILVIFSRKLHENEKKNNGPGWSGERARSRILRSANAVHKIS